MSDASRSKAAVIAHETKTPDSSGGPSRGFRRRLEVETSGVRDALKILDSAMPIERDGESSPKRRKVELANDW